MKRKLIIASLITASMAAISIANAQRHSVNIVPMPVSITVNEGQFNITKETRLSVEQSDLKGAAAQFAEYAQGVVGAKLKVTQSALPVDGRINMSVTRTLAAEQYTLTVTPKRIMIKGGSERAVLYALQSLRQMLPAKADAQGNVAISAVEINDKPYFAYRGTMLDVCRHMFSVEEVKRYIDILSLHKINTFHWHLTDDQGWRIEIKKYPELTKVGSIRNRTLIGHHKAENKQYDEKPYGGFFTQKEVKEIVKYAAERYIEVIPEIEMPGHAQAALTAYPWLGCTGGPYEVRTRWGISDDVFCAGKETTYEFIQNVLTEVLELFPSKYIHIGGDECPKVRWEKCSACQKLIKDNNLKDEHELQSYLVQRMEKWVMKKGRNIIGWDEILEGGLSKTATVMSWRGSKGGIAAAKSGNNVIMSPNTHCYLDYYQADDCTRQPLSIGGNLPIEKVYSLDPYTDLDTNEHKYILGVQANLWTEYIGDFDHVQFMLLPRLAAVAEVGWAYNRKNYDSFKERMNTLKDTYELAGYKYAPFMFE